MPDRARITVPVGVDPVPMDEVSRLFQGGLEALRRVDPDAAAGVVEFRVVRTNG